MIGAISNGGLKNHWKSYSFRIYRHKLHTLGHSQAPSHLLRRCVADDKHASTRVATIEGNSEWSNRSNERAGKQKLKS